MIGAVLASMGALLAAAQPASAPPPVRLAPVGCVEIPDPSVRLPLRVELGARLLDDVAADPRDFLLLSIACAQSDATMLAVRQGGGTPVRRLVPLGDVAPEARPRALALAAVELLQVADLRDTPPPPPVAAVDKESAGAPVARGPTPYVGAAFLVFGAFFGTGSYLTTGGAIRLGLELGSQNPPDPTWGLNLAYEFVGLGGSSQAVFMNEALALAQRRSGRFTAELGLGARLGWVEDSVTSSAGITMTTSRRAGGPLASVGLNAPWQQWLVSDRARFARGLSSDFSVQVGYDFRGAGVWVVPQFGFTARF